QDLDGLAALGDLALSGGNDAFGRLRRVHPRALGRRPRRGLFQRLLVNGDRLLHQDGLDIPFTVDLQLAQVALAADPGLVEATVGRDAGALDLLAGDDFRLLQRLGSGDLELFDRAAAFDSCRFQRLFARDVGGLDLLARV